MLLVAVLVPYFVATGCGSPPSARADREPTARADSTPSAPERAANRPEVAEGAQDDHPSAPPPKNAPWWFGQGVPGTAERECVTVNPLLGKTGGLGAIRSGQFVAGPFPAYVGGWNPRADLKLWFAPLHTRRMPGLEVKATLLGEPGKALVVRRTGFAWGDQRAPRDSARAIDTRFYPGTMRLPGAGTWRLVASSGPDWGCFEVKLPG